MKTILFESEHVLVAHLRKPAAPKPVFVTFNEMGYRPDGANFWGDALFERLPFSAVGVVSKTPNWYPLADMREAVASILEATPGACRITYGVSQGGYGALKFAAALQARGALAFGPQWSIDPADVGAFDTRYLEYFRPEGDNGRRIETADVSCNGFTFYDPYLTVDALNGARLSELPGIVPIPCPFTGHAPLQALTEAHLSRAFLEKAAALIEAGRPAVEIRSSLRRYIRSARAKSPTYAKQRAVALRKRGKLYLLAGLKREAPGPLSASATLVAALQQNDARAIGRLMPAVTYQDAKSAGLLKLWNYLRAAGLREAELRLADLILGHAEPVFVKLHAVNSLISLEFLALARLALRDIAAEHGVTKPVAQQVLNFARKLEMPEIERLARQALAEG